MLRPRPPLRRLLVTHRGVSVDEAVFPRHLRPLAALLSIYIASVVFVAAHGPRPMVDEWIYIESARQFAESGNLVLSPISFTTGIFEALYGGAVIWVLGESLVALVISTALLAALAGVALWDLLTRSAISKDFAVTVVGGFLFAAVHYGLTATYMTDAHAISLGVISAALLSRGVDESQVRPFWLLFGSIVASAAYLSRPGTIGVLLGVVVVAVVRREWSALVWSLPVPIATVATHLAGRVLGTIPAVRSDVVERLALPSAATMRDVVIAAAITIGIWLIPLVPAVAGSIRRTWHSSQNLRVALLISLGISLLGLTASPGLPLVGNWLNRTGLFPIDQSTVGTRPLLVDWPTYLVIALFAILIAVVALARTVSSRKKPILRSAELGLWGSACVSILLVVLTQVAAWGSILDRYLVVLLPAVLFSVTVRTLGETSALLRRWCASILGVVAVLCTVLAVDGMSLQSAIFQTAEHAVGQAIEVEELDGGAAWTGSKFGIDMTPADIVPVDDRHWWRGRFAPGLDPRYVVAINPAITRCMLHKVNVDSLIGADSKVVLVDTTCLEADA